MSLISLRNLPNLKARNRRETCSDFHSTHPYLRNPLSLRHIHPLSRTRFLRWAWPDSITLDTSVSTRPLALGASPISPCFYRFYFRTNGQQLRQIRHVREVPAFFSPLSIFYPSHERVTVIFIFLTVLYSQVYNAQVCRYLGFETYEIRKYFIKNLKMRKTTVSFLQI